MLKWQVTTLSQGSYLARTWWHSTIFSRECHMLACHHSHEKQCCWRRADMSPFSQKASLAKRYWRGTKSREKYIWWRRLTFRHSHEKFDLWQRHVDMASFLRKAFMAKMCWSYSHKKLILCLPRPGNFSIFLRLFPNQTVLWYDKFSWDLLSLNFFFIFITNLVYAIKQLLVTLSSKHVSWHRWKWSFLYQLPRKTIPRQRVWSFALLLY